MLLIISRLDTNARLSIRRRAIQIILIDRCQSFSPKRMHMINGGVHTGVGHVVDIPLVEDTHGGSNKVFRWVNSGVKMGILEW